MVPLRLHKSADEILTTLAAYTQRISDSGHLGTSKRNGCVILAQARFAGSPFARRRILPSDWRSATRQRTLRLRHRQPSLVWFAPEHPPHNDGPVFFGAHGCDQVPSFTEVDRDCPELIPTKQLSSSISHPVVAASRAHQCRLSFSTSTLHS